MEARRDPRIRVVIALVGLLLLARPAAADHHEPVDWPVTATVDTSPEAVTVEAGVSNNVGGGSGGSSSSGANCTLQATNIGESLSQEFIDRGGDELPYLVWCDEELVGLVWIGVGEGGTPGAAPSPEEIAMQLRDRIPIPTVTIEVNPDQGLVGIDSWFWIDGYDGQPISESTNAFGRRIEVEARVQRYEWRFGDGRTVMSDSPGRPYPDRSDVRHVYERSSLGHEDGYPVEVGFVFAVRYRVDGGGWLELPGIERVADASYLVRESQAVIQQ